MAFDIPSLREIVGSDVGAIVPNGDVDALASAMCELAMDSDRRALLGANGKAKVAHLKWDLAAEAQGTIYREMTQNETHIPAAEAEAPFRTAPN